MRPAVARMSRRGPRCRASLRCLVTLHCSSRCKWGPRGFSTGRSSRPVTVESGISCVLYTVENQDQQTCQLRDRRKTHCLIRENCLLRERQNAPQKADKMVLKGGKGENKIPEDKSLSDEEDKSPLTTETNRGDMKRLAAKPRRRIVANHEIQMPLPRRGIAANCGEDCR